jgi:hypothetical protein
MRMGSPAPRRGLAARAVLPIALPAVALWAFIASGPALSLTQGQAYETTAATGTPYETEAATGTPYETEAATASGTELAATPTVPTETSTPVTQPTPGGSVGAGTPGAGGVPGLTPPSTDVRAKGVGSGDEVLTVILFALALATAALVITRPRRREMRSYPVLTR